MLASASPWPLTARPSTVGHVLERAVAAVPPEGVALGVVGDEPVEPAVAVEVGRQHAHAAARRPPRPPWLVTSRNRPFPSFR